MLNREKVIVAFEAKRFQFEEFLTGRAEQQELLTDRLDRFFALDSAAILSRLDELDSRWPGAIPTSELDRADGLVIPFAQQWSSHEQARAWALQILKDRPVLAVDGSQITPTKDFSIPVGAVQIGWFINDHCSGGGYVKDLAFELLSPAELADGNEDEAERGFPDWRVNQQRFVRECEKLCELMTTLAEDSAIEPPLCFFDGSFVISFAGQMRPQRARPYLAAVEELLVCSDRWQTPLVGFVDSSYSHDLVGLLDTLFGQGQALTLSDGGLLSPLLPNWGDRSPFFICARADSLSREGRAAFYTDVAFCYIRLTQEQAPARLEIPRWLLEAGRGDEVVDLVRAECVVGAGYPYAVETADALAVISQQDRQRFYALFQQFAERNGLPLTQARKSLSKQSRR
ncbi:MAG: DNA double-strand break repair nuclease NurA [Caldilineaceae bacterium]|nr:DNA double-strand break repair nuclease NurA [Caldilineaceae bacterium]